MTEFTDASWTTPETGLSAADYCDCCLIDENKSGEDKIKDDCALPIRSKPGAPVNKQALRAVASVLGGARGGLKGFSAEAKAKAAKRLAALEKEAGIGEDADSSKSARDLREIGEAVAKAGRELLTSFVKTTSDYHFTITKNADGTYHWTGTSSSNAKDRDQEIVSKMALDLDVYRTKHYGDDSELRLFHIPASRLGGPPDFRTVVDGLLVESGDFDDTPFAKGVAEYMIAHPEANDGSGWGMSIGFNGIPDRTGTYNQIETVERSVLPLSQAANPYTKFKLIGDEDMALKPAQKSLLDDIGQEISDPAFLATLRQITEAAEKSKSLDDAGVRRKDVTSTNAQYVSGPGGIASTPGVRGKKRVAKAEDTSDGADGEDDEPDDGPTIHGNTKCADCGHRASDHEKDDSEDGYGGCTKCKCKSFAMEDKSMDDEGEMDPAGKSIKSLTYAELGDAIAEHTKDALDAAFEQSPVVKQLVKLVTALAEGQATLSDQVEALLSGDDQIKAVHEKPRILSEYLASRSGGTRIEKSDPLARRTKQAERAQEKEARILEEANGNVFNVLPGFREIKEEES